MNRAAHWVLALAVATGLSPGIAGAAISTTKHNFSLTTNNVFANPTSQVDGQICVFCHTPHNGIAANKNTLLLWNHTRSTSTFSWSDANFTTNGTAFANSISGANYAGQSAKCLSCHDGTVSVGSIYWDNATGPVSVTMGGTGQTAGAISATSAYLIASGGGSDLKGNHPVAMPFPLNGAVSTYNGITEGASMLTSGWIADPRALSPPIKIYGPNPGEGNATTGSAGIECTSCHDPHGTTNTYFLRRSKAGSDLCLSCHNK